MIENDYNGDVYGLWTSNGIGSAIIGETER